MRILLGIDDSPHSREALDYVRRSTWPKGTRVLVLSVARPVVAAYAEVYAPAAPYADQVWQDTLQFHQEIAAEAERSLRESGFETEARVLQGDPRTALVEVAKVENIDLVVVGSHGRSGVAKLLMGSVASHVVTHAPCNVLVVKVHPDRLM